MVPGPVLVLGAIGRQSYHSGPFSCPIQAEGIPFNATWSDEPGQDRPWPAKGRSTGDPLDYARHERMNRSRSRAPREPGTRPDGKR